MSDYTWTQDYQRTWETLNEDKKQPNQDQQTRKHHFRPLLRHLILALDCSKYSLMTDFKPSRWKLLQNFAQEFHREFYIYNPLSKLNILLIKDGIVSIIEDINSLQITPSGEFSLSNTLRMSNFLLQESGFHWSKEILLIQSSLWTCDSQEIWETISLIQQSGIRVNIISMVPQVYTMKQTSVLTNGDFQTVKHEKDLKEKWMEKSRISVPAMATSLIPMAFPIFSSDYTPCVCHNQLNQGFICPVCSSKTCKLPNFCQVCEFLLISAPHLAKAALSLSILNTFILEGEGFCMACEVWCEQVKRCVECGFKSCEDCEEFMANNFARCIGCSF